MDHHRHVFLAVLTNIGQAEAVWLHEVQLDSGHRFVVAKGRLSLNIQLWTVECGFPFGFVVVEVQVIHGSLQQLLGFVPHFVIPVVLFLVLRVTQGQAEAVIGDVEVLVDVHNQVQNLGKFIPDLVNSNKGVAIVQGHFTNPLQT